MSDVTCCSETQGGPKSCLRKGYAPEPCLSRHTTNSDPDVPCDVVAVVDISVPQMNEASPLVTVKQSIQQLKVKAMCYTLYIR